MNPLTLVKRIQNINAKEAALGISDEASWHAKYKESAYVYVGGIPYDLTEGDLLAVFAQYGEIVDVNLVRDKGTGKSKGFAFVAYEDQRSTNLAVDNLNGAQILGRTIRVDHVSNYKKKEEEDEETEQRKREERGVCRAFQKGECNRGTGCRFSHDERRAANAGWGHEEDRWSRWASDNKFEDSARHERYSDVSRHISESANQERHEFSDRDTRGSRAKGNNMDSDRHNEHGELDSRDGRQRARKRDWNGSRRTQGMRTTGMTLITEDQEDMMYQTQVKIAIRERRKYQENMNLNPTIGNVGRTEGLVTTYIVDPQTKSIGIDLTNRRNLVVGVKNRCMIYPSDYLICLWLHIFVGIAFRIKVWFSMLLPFGSRLKGGAT